MSHLFGLMGKAATLCFESSKVRTVLVESAPGVRYIFLEARLPSKVWRFQGGVEGNLRRRFIFLGHQLTE